MKNKIYKNTKNIRKQGPKKTMKRRYYGGVNFNYIESTINQDANTGKSNLIGFEPISQTDIDINHWIKEDVDNIIINFEDNIYCMKRSYFDENGLFSFAVLQPYILYNPVINNDYYIDFYKLGIENSGIMSVNDLERFHDEEINTFSIIKSKKKINTISTIIVNNHSIKQEQLHDLNLQFSDEERKYISNYTFEHSEYINKYLRGVLNENDEEKFDVKKHILEIDNIFYKYGSISSKPIKLYRGTTESTFGLNKTYISTSTSLKVAKGFSGETCCVYNFTLSPGIPFLSLEGISYSKGKEFEILLPRGLMINLIKEIQVPIKVYKIVDKKRKLVEVLQTRYDCNIDMATTVQFKPFDCIQKDILIHKSRDYQSIY